MVIFGTPILANSFPCLPPFTYNYCPSAASRPCNLAFQRITVVMTPKNKYKDESLSFYTVIRQEFEKWSYDNQPEFRVNFHFSVWQYAHSTRYYSYAFLINLTRTIAHQIRHQFEGNVTVHKCYLHSARMQLSFCLVTVSLYVATTTFPLRKTWEKNPTISHHSLLISMLHLYVSTILFTLRKLF